MRKLLVANWKMNPATLKEALELTQAVSKYHQSEYVEVVLCPPFVYLEEVSKLLKASAKGGSASGGNSHKLKVSLGAQDVFWEEKGSYTGEISAAMLKNAGVKYVIVGHSERRRLLDETDEMVASKLRQTVQAGLHAVLCVGESVNEREEGMKTAKDVVYRQLVEGLKAIADVAGDERGRVIVAYEPVWAISGGGVGHPDTPEDAVTMIQAIRELLTGEFSFSEPCILYGGLVSEKNVADFLRHPEISGALIGSASLDAQQFKNIIHTTAMLESS